MLFPKEIVRKGTQQTRREFELCLRVPISAFITATLPAHAKGKHLRYIILKIQCLSHWCYPAEESLYVILAYFKLLSQLPRIIKIYEKQTIFNVSCSNY